MTLHIAIVLCSIGLLFAVVTLELVRRKYLRAEYALLWGLLALVAVGLAVVPGVVELLVRVTGMAYQSSIIVLLFLFTALMLMNFSVIASRQGGRIVRLTQEIALLRLELEELRKSGDKQSVSK